MYSPKIAEDLVHVLYFAAKDRKMSMTKLVNAIIREALASNNLPKISAEIPATEICAQPNEPCNAAA